MNEIINKLQNMINITEEIYVAAVYENREIIIEKSQTLLEKFNLYMEEKQKMNISAYDDIINKFENLIEAVNACDTIKIIDSIKFEIQPQLQSEYKTIGEWISGH